MTIEKPTAKNAILTTIPPIKNAMGESPTISIARKIERRLAKTTESTKKPPLHP